MSKYLCSAVFMGWLTLVAAPAPVHASGNSADLDGYCNSGSGGSVLPVRKNARYDRREKIWQCVISTPRNNGRAVTNIDPKDVCRRQFKTDRVHFHKGDDPALQSDMHCGVHSGIMPPQAWMKPAGFELCNRSEDQTIAVGYGHIPYPEAGEDPQTYLPIPKWRTQGWWEVEKNSCQIFNMPAYSDHTTYSGSVIVFAASKRKLFEGDGSKICVRPNWRFDVVNDIYGPNLPKGLKPTCRDPIFRLIPGTTLKLRREYVTHNFTG